ncbi:MAG: nucleotide exchange factor GrpE [Acidobacteria bacterium]|nr:MAG: nucleotide exchange factor GrpE [Acidobacteriota bacterium]
MRDTGEAGETQEPRAEAPEDEPGESLDEGLDESLDETLNEEELRQRLRELRAAAESAESKASEHLNDLQRLKAEFDNFRKRVLREQTEAIGRAGERLVEELLDVVDDFDLALDALESLGDEHSGLAKGIEAVYGKLFALLDKQGVERIDTRGVPFDAEVHEAVAHDDSGADGELIVAEVFRPGYKMGQKVIRPAMVKVASDTGSQSR